MISIASLIAIVLIIIGGYMMYYSTMCMKCLNYLLYLNENHFSDEFYDECKKYYLDAAINKHQNQMELGKEIIKSKKSYEDFYKARLIKGYII